MPVDVDQWLVLRFASAGREIMGKARHTGVEAHFHSHDTCIFETLPPNTGSGPDSNLLSSTG